MGLVAKPIHPKILEGIHRLTDALAGEAPNPTMVGLGAEKQRAKRTACIQALTAFARVCFSAGQSEAAREFAPNKRLADAAAEYHIKHGKRQRVPKYNG